MSNSNSSKQILLSVIGIAVVIILLVGVTFAFFNYTRTGSSNVIKVGRIYFNTEQATVNLDNIFPISSENVETDTDNVSTATITITGDTTYSDGIEYLVSAVDINNTVNGKVLPINLDISYEASTNKTIGESDSNYYTNRGGNNTIYKILSDRVYLEDNNKLLVGYIAHGETGIDGTITIKAYIDKDIIGVSDTYPEYTKRIVNPNMSEEEMATCVSYVTSKYFFRNGENANDYCNGTGTYNGRTFQEELDSNRVYNTYLQYFINNNIVIDVYSNNTNAEWAKNRIIMTTDEWNSLNTSGLSFKIKVEANEGIWTDYPGNSMNTIPTDVFVKYGINDNVKEIYFDRMSDTEMEERYEAATIKADITYNGEGKVLAWLETNDIDDTKYTMYIVSNGTTILNTADYSLFYDVGLTYADKIEFNNVNTSRITSMYKLFNRQENLKELDLRSFDTSNVVSMDSLVYSSGSIKKINMEGLDLRKVVDMYGMFYSNYELIEVNLNGTRTRDVETMTNMFYNSDKLEDINLENWGGDNLESMDTFIQGGNCQRKNINMKNFNFGKMTNVSYLFSWLVALESVDLSGAKMPYVTNASGLFSNCRKLINVNLSNISIPNLERLDDMFYDNNSLEEIDLSSLDVTNVSNTANMFYNNSSLQKIYVSNTWNLNNVTSSANMFYGCTSLVGGNGTTYDENIIDKTYARIDGKDGLDGYLTLKNN